MGFRMELPNYVVCDGCGEYLNCTYTIDVRAARRVRSVVNRRLFESLDRQMSDRARDEGWLVEGDRCWCPECADRMGDRGPRPDFRDVTAKGVIGDLRLAYRVRHPRDGGGR